MKDSYEDFVAKFKVKKTTDDCYTPPAVYDAVLAYVIEKASLGEGVRIARPFQPGGDYKRFAYGPETVVVDNPPFSIISEIARFYLATGVRFFLFAPHLTLFTADIRCTHIVTGADITYENGAVVNTSFLSNLFGNVRIIGDPALAEAVRVAQMADKPKPLPKYEYPDNVITVSKIERMVKAGIPFHVNESECRHIRALDSQRAVGKSAFGSAYLVSDTAAAAAAAAAAEKTVWRLSARELEIISHLK